MFAVMCVVLLFLIAGHAAHQNPPPAGVSSETPSWSPDGKRIVFSAGPWMRHQIYVMDADGRNVRKLTDGEQNRWPAWSPDGRSIVFMSDRDGQGELYLMAPDGSRQRRLTNSPAHEFAPAWSPRADVIGFVVEMPGAKQQLGMIGSDGRGSRIIDGDHLYYGRPMWMPDGSRMLIAANRNPASTAANRWNVPTRIYAYRPDGSAPVAMTPEGYDTNPSISPDGLRMVYDTGDGTSWASDRDQWKLWVTDFKGSKPFRLTATAANDWGAAWSPDGKRIAFSSGRNRVYELHVMSIDGKTRDALTRTDRLPDALR